MVRSYELGVLYVPSAFVRIHELQLHDMTQMFERELNLFCTHQRFPALQDKFLKNNSFSFKSWFNLMVVYTFKGYVKLGFSEVFPQVNIILVSF